MEISELLSRPHDMNPGSVAPYLESFAAQMASVGHTSLTIGFYLGSAIHFGGWLKHRAWPSRTSMKRPSRRSEHIAANVLDAAAKNVSRAYTARVQRFVSFCGNTVPSERSLDSAAETPSSLSPFREWLLQHRGLAMVTVDRHERLLNRMLPALGADAGQYNAASVRRAAWTRSAAVGPLTPRRLSARSESICDSWQRVAHANLVSTMHCQPWPNGNFPRCPDTSTPNKWPASLTPVARTGRRGEGPCDRIVAASAWAPSGRHCQHAPN